MKFDGFLSLLEMREGNYNGIKKMVKNHMTIKRLVHI